MLTLLISIICLYIASLLRSIVLLWQTSIKQLWISIIIQLVVIARGFVFWWAPNANGNFLEQGLLGQTLVLLVASLGIVGIYLAERSFIKNEAIQKELIESQIRFSRLINQSPLAIQIVSKDGLLVDANLAWETLWQVKKEDLIDHYNLFEDEQLVQKGFLKVVETAKRTKTAVYIPNSFYSSSIPGRDGTNDRWLKGYLYPLETDNIENFALITEDITDQIDAETAYKQSENRWLQLVENYPEAVLLSVDYIFVYCNPATVKIFGAQKKEEILGKPLFDFNNEGKSKVLMERLAMLERGESTPPVEHQMVGLDGVKRDLISFSIPVTYQGKDAIQTVIRDVTKQKLNQRKLNHHEKLAAVGQLAAGIAHDFNNALSVISLNSELLLRDIELNAKVHKRVDLIHQQTLRAASLTAQILDFSRQSVIHLESINLNRFFEKFIELLRSILSEEITINLLNYDSENQLVIEADKSRLQQLFMNLAINSRDAMPNGGNIKIELLIGDSDHDKDFQEFYWPNGYAEIRFSDSGVGIPDEIMEHLFEPFYTTKQRGKGTGLGLAQVYGIVSQHNGIVQVNTDKTSGTMVSICFPLSLDDEVSENNISYEVNDTGNQELVLIVEDHTDSGEVLSDILEKLNYKTIVANNGLQALDVVNSTSEPIALIISDIVMPKLNGIEFAKKMLDRNSLIPIILMTGHPLSNQLDQVDSSNIHAVLQKPLNINVLSTTIFSALQKT